MKAWEEKTKQNVNVSRCTAMLREIWYKDPSWKSQKWEKRDLVKTFKQLTGFKDLMLCYSWKKKKKSCVKAVKFQLVRLFWPTWRVFIFPPVRITLLCSFKSKPAFKGWVRVHSRLKIFLEKPGSRLTRHLS